MERTGNKTQNTLRIAQMEDRNLSNDSFHFGKYIRSILQGEGRSIAWFAAQMNCDRSNMYKLLSKSHQSSEFLIRASRVLNHNLFDAASEWLKMGGVIEENKELF